MRRETPVRKITLDSLKSTRIDNSMRSPWAALNAKVMLIDAQPIFLDILSAGFVKRGFSEIATATSFEEAQASMSEQKPDLIIVGFDSVDPRGAHAINAIKRDAALKTTPFLVTTTKDQESIVKTKFHLSDQDVFCKPVDMGQLISAAVDRISDQSMRSTISATVRRSRAIPASDKYRRLRQIVGRSEQ